MNVATAMPSGLSDYASIAQAGTNNLATIT
ncbi:hypothetical protein KQ248_07485 [Stutzerimonas zhaodongensis]|uniref:Uncharacterized protein n=1 Tax=Stutzerimonas zhaodongensis TaxID=1176257 RepID=A0ABX8J422_9GAMM|nr:hypothetical protein KQ248_07485 [Stutzerimonas zhaodongensis]